MPYTKNPKGRDPEKARDRQRRYRAAHLEHLQAKAREYRKLNREEYAAYSHEYYLRNKEKFQAYRRKHRAANAARLRAGDLRRLYSLTPELFERLLKHQNYACAICRHPFDGIGVQGIPHVDHQHGGDVRGILCSKCNPALGAFMDNPDFLWAAIQYLAEPPAAGFLTPQLKLFEEPA